MTDTEAKKLLEQLNDENFIKSLKPLHHYCAKCGVVDNIVKREITETRKIKSEEITVKGAAAFCPICGARISDECDKEMESQAFMIYRERHGLLQPEEVRCLREKYGLSARQFSALLNLGDHIIYDIERGAIATRTIDNTIRNIRSYSMLRKYLSSTKTKLHKKEVDRLLLLCEYQADIINETSNYSAVIINKLLPCFA